MNRRSLPIPLPDPVRPGFPPELPPGREPPFSGRRSRIFEALGNGVLLVPSGPSLSRPGGTELPWRPDADLLWLTGWREPESLLLLRGFADEARTVLFVRERDPVREQWEGIRMGPDAAREWVGADEAWPISELAERLPALLRGADRIFHRFGIDAGVDHAVLRALEAARTSIRRTGRGPWGVVERGRLLDPVRVRKDAFEIALLREASHITARGLDEALASLRPGVGEWELEGTLLGSFRRQGAEGPSFPPIVAGGARACILHYRDNSAPLDAGSLVLLDCGAEYGGYAGDLTRTVPVSGRFDPLQRDLYSVVEGARRAAVAAVRPGATLEGVHDAAVRALVEGLRALGALRGKPSVLLRRGALQRWYPHRTSHWLGLDVHDPGDVVDPEGVPIPFEPGMVLTVEPGLYIPPDAEGAFARWAGTGIRIEDDVLVTPSGAEILAPGLPSDPDAIEERIGGR